MIENLISVEKWPSQALVLPRLQAHRGYWLAGAQENTLEAFRQARQRGALMFECDVRLSKDRVPVVFHDENLARLGQRPERVEDLTASELKKCVRAPTLREVLMDPDVPRLANLELKTNKKMDDPLERKVAEVVRSVKAESRVLFSSFNPLSLYRMSLHLPQVPRALLVTNEIHESNHWILRKMILAPFLSFHLLHLHYRMVTEETMKFWKSQKIPVAVWTVNERENIQKYWRWGCVSVITDTV